MRTPLSRIETTAGAFVVLAALLALGGLVASVRRAHLLDILSERWTITAVAEDAYGVSVGSPVKVREVEVGSVTDVGFALEGKFENKPVRIVMRIQPIAAGLLGSETVAVIVRPPFGSGMPPFGTLSVELRTGGTTGLARDAVISAIGEDSMVGTFVKMREDVAAIRGEFVETLKALRATIENMRVISDDLAHGHGFAGRMLRDESTADSLGKLLADARATTSDLRKVAADAKLAAAEAPALTHDAKETTDDAKKAIAKLGPALDALPTILASIERTLAATEELTKDLKVAASHAPELARKVDSSLDETDRLVEAMQKNFLLRGTLPERTAPRTAADPRPDLSAPDGGKP